MVQLVLVNWNMQQMDGLAFAREVRHQQMHGRCPIILMATAHERDSLTKSHSDLAELVDAFLTKPFTPTMLKHAAWEATEAGTSEKTGPASIFHTGPLEGLRILVVEDNPINQQVAEELLRAEGASVTIANNGRLGVEAVANAVPQFDVVLMDLQMPEMDGYTASVTIRNELGLRVLPIIAMTANAMASDRDACLAAGMDDHIGKPFDLSKLVSMIRRFAGRTEAPGEEQKPSSLPVGVPVPGEMDDSAALARLGQNRALYGKILASFQKDVESLVAQLNGLLATGNLPEVAKTLHTFKGLAMTVGAIHLGGVLRYAELQAKEASTGTGSGSADTLRKCIKEVEQAVEASAQGIQALRALYDLRTSPAGAAASPGPEKLLQDLRELRALLEVADLRSLEVHASFVKCYGSHFGDQLNALNESISSFDFEQAVVQCDVLMQQILRSTST